MKKLLFILTTFLILMFGCSTMPNTVDQQPTKHEIEITLKQIDGKTVAIVAKDGKKEKVVKAMDVGNPGLELSQLSGIPKSNDKCFIKLFSGLSVSDVTRTWNDLIYLENEIHAQILELQYQSHFLNS